MLHKINPKVQRAVADASLPVKAIRTRTRPWKEAGGADYDTLLELNLEETVRQEGGKAKEELIINGEPMFYSIMRGALQVRRELATLMRLSGIVLLTSFHRSCIYDRKL